jgi:PAS domain S-box-containing protein
MLLKLLWTFFVATVNFVQQLNTEIGITMSIEQNSALVRSDRKGLIVEWDDGAEAFFGYTREEAIGESLDLIVPEEFRDRHWTGFNNAIASGICRMDRAITNVPVRCKDGQIRPFPGRFIFLQDARETVVGVIGLYAKRHGSEKPFGPIVPLKLDA